MNDKQALNVFQQLAAIPTYAKLESASIIDAAMMLQLEVNIKNYSAKKKQKYRLDLYIDAEGKTTSRPLQPIDAAILISSISPSKSKSFVLKEEGGKRFVEIMSDSQLKAVEVTKIHGSPYSDNFFGRIAWSEDEETVVYVAEPCKTESPNYIYQQDAGEGYSGKLKPCPIIISNIGQTPEVRIIDNLPLFGVSQPLIFKNTLVFVGIPENALILGIKYCTNRKMYLYSCTLNGTNLKQLTKGNMNARYPVLIPESSQLLFLSNEIGGAHDSCAQLMSFNLETQVEDILVPMVHSPRNNEFPGIYARLLNEKSVITNNNDTYLVIETFWRSRQVLVAVELNSKSVTPLCSEGNDSFSLLGSIGNCIIATKSRLNQPDSINSMNLTNLATAEWKLLHHPKIASCTEKLLADVSFSLMGVDGESADLEMIVLKNSKRGCHEILSSRERAPVIIMPHGGPHGTYSTLFNPLFTGMAALGFVCVLINYTGSVGFGNAAIKSLLGKVGDLEISQTHAAAQFIASQSLIDSKNIFFQGGSHGGFIGSHLATKFPNFYRAFSIRNPVVNIGGMPFNSDIPDWCFAETAITTKNYCLVTPANYEQMYNTSCIASFDGQSSSIFLALGMNDRRVPPSQGLRWYEMLKSCNCEIILKTYPEDGHALDRFETEMDVFESTVAFFISHLQESF